MNESVSLILAILGAMMTWTATIVTLTMWLAGKFRALEQLIYREMYQHEKKDQERFSDTTNRLMVLEMNVMGHTQTGNGHEPKAYR